MAPPASELANLLHLPDDAKRRRSSRSQTRPDLHQHRLARVLLLHRLVVLDRKAGIASLPDHPLWGQESAMRREPVVARLEGAVVASRIVHSDLRHALRVEPIARPNG